MKAAKILLVMILVLAFACTALAVAPAPRGAKAPRAPKPAAKGQVQPQWWGRPPADGSHVMGKVANVSASSIAVETRDGVKSFVVNEKTKVRVRGQRATIADVKVGDPVAVKFALQENNVAVALAVIVPKPSVAGEITAVERDVMTLKCPDGVLRRVLISSATQIRSRGYVGTVADLRIGYKAHAVGDLAGEELKADLISFMPAVAKGAVTAVDGDLITVKTVRQHVLQCRASAATAVTIRPRVGPNQKGTLADVKVGMPCNIGFHEARTGEVQLLWIDLLTGM